MLCDRLQGDPKDGIADFVREGEEAFALAKEYLFARYHHPHQVISALVAQVINLGPVQGKKDLRRFYDVASSAVRSLKALARSEYQEETGVVSDIMLLVVIKSKLYPYLLQEWEAVVRKAIRKAKEAEAAAEAAALQAQELPDESEQNESASAVSVASSSSGNIWKRIGLDALLAFLREEVHIYESSNLGRFDKESKESKEKEKEKKPETKKTSHGLAGSSQQQQQSQQSQKPEKQQKSEGKSSSGSQGAQQKKKRCAFCSAEGHKPADCTKVAGLSTEERWTKTKAAFPRVCFRCLSWGHMINDCPSSGCEVEGCSKKEGHHTLLHRPPKTQ
jgi:hypothetical protein